MSTFNTDFSEPFYGYQFNKGPTTPTNLAIGSGVLIAGQTNLLTWQHNDPEGDPQAKYRIAWRVV